MEAKYTKGKWSIDKFGSIVDSQGKTIQCFGVAIPMVSSDEAKANAKLIAAAPDMFNILERLIKANKNLAKYNPDTFILPELWREAESILKKATE